MPPKIVPIVEGHGESDAVPVLLRRIANELQIFVVHVAKPIRCPRQKLVKAGKLERAVELAILKGGNAARVLLLIDANGDCPAELGPTLLARARRARPNVPVAVVLAKHEFEAWFLGSLESLGPDFELALGKDLRRNPEDISGAKEHLSDLLGIHYSEVIDQVAMTARFDMNMARKSCPSFDKCWRAVADLLAG